MIILICIACIFSLLSTAIMSYIALATSTGPWMEPTLVLFGIAAFRGVFRYFYQSNDHAIGFATIAGGVGGIVAVAASWTIPTLYFLNPSLFNTWLQQPYYFVGIIALVTLVAGILGFIIALALEDHLLNELNISFPIGQLVHKMIYAHNQMKQTIELIAGATITVIITIINKCSTLISQTINIIPSLSYGLIHIPAICLRFDLLPIFLSIGFVTGHVIAMPLLFGLVSKIFFIEPVQRYFFAAVAREAFLNSFVSGIVLQGALISLLEWPKVFSGTIKQAHTNNLLNYFNFKALMRNSWYILIGSIGCALLSAFFYFFHFSIMSQIYIILFTLLCTYQVLLIAGKTGLAPFPRFATFVLIPGMIIFGFDDVQIMLVSAFVEICCAVAVDILFGRKMAKLSGMNRRTATFFQLLGFVISALAVGIIFYALIHKFGLGSPELLAQRAQARALLVKSKNFNNYLVMFIGGIFGFSLQYVRVNYLLVIGALLMQPELSVSLILGGLLTYLPKDKESWYPFWSGVFAAGSLLMLVHAFM